MYHSEVWIVLTACELIVVTEAASYLHNSPLSLSNQLMVC